MSSFHWLIARVYFFTNFYKTTFQISCFCNNKHAYFDSESSIKLLVISFLSATICISFKVKYAQLYLSTHLFHVSIYAYSATSK